MLVIGLAAALVWSVRSRKAPEGHAAIEPRPVAERAQLLGEEAERVALYREAAPAVVNITAVIRYRDQRAQTREVPEGNGSGVVWDTAGHIVTNYHILEKADAAYVTLEDGSSYKAKLVGAYADKDLAVLKVDAPPSLLRPVRVGTSDDLDVGQSVLAIGNPFGLAQTLTSGVISGLGREITSLNGRPIQDVIQTDAAINPGNSGGPLFDSSGRMIGVNTQIYSQSGDSAGIGFAIPISAVNRIVPQLIRTGKVTKPVLGITPLPKSVALRYGIPGVVVRRAHPGEPAAEAGILGTHRDDRGRWTLGDIIMSIDGQAVHEPNDIYRILDRKNAGDKVEVKFTRGGAAKTIVIELG